MTHFSFTVESRTGWMLPLSCYEIVIRGKMFFRSLNSCLSDAWDIESTRFSTVGLSVPCMQDNLVVESACVSCANGMRDRHNDSTLTDVSVAKV